MNIYEQIIASADSLAPELIALRRDFHKYAESAWEEMRTSSIIARKLTDLGYEVLVGDQVCDRDARMGVPSEEVLEASYQRAVEQGADPEFVQATRGGMTGVIGILRCGDGPVVAMRFDIDALGVIESTAEDHLPAKEGFRSVNPGVMHACGHDGHACSGLGVAAILMQIREHLHGTVKLIFQPGEEGVRGAKSIVAKGHLDDVDYLLGAHVSSMRDADSDVSGATTDFLATNKYDVIFRGKASHAGGHPEDGINALSAAATAVLNLQAIPRHSGGATRINIGKLIAGSGRNVIADEAFMELEVRGDTTALNEYMAQHAVRILESAATMHGCTMELKTMGGAESALCDVPLAEKVVQIASEKLGLKAAPNLTHKCGGSEDVTYMMNRVQSHGGHATFFWVHVPVAGGAHHRNFNFEESYIIKCAKIFCATVYDLMQ